MPYCINQRGAISSPYLSVVARVNLSVFQGFMPLCINDCHGRTSSTSDAGRSGGADSTSDAGRSSGANGTLGAGRAGGANRPLGAGGSGRPGRTRDAHRPGGSHDARRPGGSGDQGRAAGLALAGLALAGIAAQAVGLLAADDVHVFRSTICHDFLLWALCAQTTVCRAGPGRALAGISRDGNF